MLLVYFMLLLLVALKLFLHDMPCKPYSVYTCSATTKQHHTI